MILRQIRLDQDQMCLLFLKHIQRSLLKAYPKTPKAQKKIQGDAVLKRMRSKGFAISDFKKVILAYNKTRPRGSPSLLTEYKKIKRRIDLLISEGYLEGKGQKKYNPTERYCRWFRLWLEVDERAMRSILSETILLMLRRSPMKRAHKDWPMERKTMVKAIKKRVNELTVHPSSKNLEKVKRMLFEYCIKFPQNETEEG